MTRRLLVMLCILLATAGCGTSWFAKDPTVIAVDSSVVEEVRSIGRIVTQTSVNPIHEGAIQVVEILVLDVDSSSYAEALSTAVERLKEHGWTVSGKDDINVMMKDRRDETSVSLGPQEDISGFGAKLDPQTTKTLHDDPKSKTYIVAALSNVK